MNFIFNKKKKILCYASKNVDTIRNCRELLVLEKLKFYNIVMETGLNGATCKMSQMANSNLLGIETWFCFHILLELYFLDVANPLIRGLLDFFPLIVLSCPGGCKCTHFFVWSRSWRVIGRHQIGVCQVIYEKSFFLKCHCFYSPCQFITDLENVLLML